MMPIAVGPDLNLLSRIAPGVLWISLLLAALRQFSPDGEAADSIRVVVISVLVGAVAIGLFMLALRVSRVNRDAATTESSGVTT